MTSDTPTVETWAEKKIERRELLKKAALGSAALGVLYVAPSFTSTGANRAYATTGNDGLGCDDIGRATILQLCYTGVDSGDSNDQGAKGGAWDATGPGTLGASPVWIEGDNYNGNGSNSWVAGEIAVNGCFNVPGNGPGNKVGPNTRVFIYSEEGGILLMTVYFHTSCSQPLEPGDVFGPIRVSQFNGND